MTEISKNFVCPLLKHPETYNPDTIDLVNDADARNYWLLSLKKMVEKFVAKAHTLNPDNPNASEQAQACYQKFNNMVDQLVNDPTALKPLSVRTLLELNENNLRDNNFKDAWLLQKETESTLALKEFPDRIAEIDLISDFRKKWLELIRGVLAGNVFDWGSNAVSDILENSKNFGLRQAMELIQKRPWFHDDVDDFINKLETHRYKKAVVFVDNAGLDFVLGILPLVRELLIQGTKIILTANSLPALNDMTYRELNLYCCKAAQNCDVIKKAIGDGQLVTVENGQRGPCLDLSNLSADLHELMLDVDLVLLEGMGRAVHTNLYAEFKVDSVKMAVLKNEWLAQSLGAQQFSIIFDYESSN